MLCFKTTQHGDMTSICIVTKYKIKLPDNGSEEKETSNALQMENKAIYHYKGEQKTLKKDQGSNWNPLRKINILKLPLL